MKLRLADFAASLAMMSTISSAAMTQTVMVGQRTTVARVSAGTALVEPHLAISPAVAGLLVGVAITTPTEGSFQEKAARQSCRTLLSRDGGRTWQSRDLVVTWCYDPWVAFTPTGTAVLAIAARAAGVDSVGPHGSLIVYRSRDGGARWTSLPTALRRSVDHPTIAVDMAQSLWRGSVYVMSGQHVRVARSRDDARTFDSTVTVTPNSLINLAETPAVLSDGTLVLSFVDAAWEGDSTNKIGFFRNRRAWVTTSVDGGATFGSPSFITDVCGQPPHFQQSFLVADASPKFRDRLYFACRRAGGGPIVVSRSADKGSRWSIAVPVAPEENDSSVKRVVTMATNARGVLAVAWMVGRPKAPCHELWVTASVDGGVSFAKPVQVSAPPCTSAAWSTSGDYFGLAAAPDGRFHLLWGEPEREGAVLLHTTVSVQ